jgi:phosphoglycolate phosphatase
VLIRNRVEDLQTGRSEPAQYLVPGARALLESLKERGLKLYLASGTDEIYMKEEARLLDVARYFDGGVYGAQDYYKSFSKKILVQRIVSSTGVLGPEIIGFGDGYVEIEEVKQVGGVTVGVATTEPECRVVDGWKRQRLIGAGADYIVPNFLCHEELMTALFPAQANTNGIQNPDRKGVEQNRDRDGAEQNRDLEGADAKALAPNDPPIEV